MLECLIEVESAIETAKKGDLDLSPCYDNESFAGYILQEKLRLSTRSLFGDYLFFCYNQKISDRVLKSLKKVRDLFGNHPFHHVMDGRLAESVKMAYKRNLKVPEELQNYKDFKINPWNNPHLNYNTPENIIRSVKNLFKGPEVFSYIPPDWTISKIDC